MKKTLIAFAAAAALTSSAFAEITFGAWLRALTAPIANDGKDTVAAMGNSWGWGCRTARLNVNAAAEDGNIGFSMGVYNDADMSISAGDEAYIWGKPVDAVKISMGKYDNNTLRGDCCYGSWNWLRPTSSWMIEDEGLLMSGNGGTGLLVEATPVEGLYVQALVPAYKKNADKALKAEEVYKNARAGFAYTIDGVGKLKAQYIGSYTAKTEASKGAWLDKDGKATSFDGEKVAKEEISWDADHVNAEVKAAFNKTLEAEFDLTAVENLWVGVGFQMKMYEDKDANPDKESTKVALGAKYQATDTVGISLSGAYQMYNKKKDDGGKDARFQFGAGVDAAVADGVSVSADVRYLAKEKDVDNSDHIAFSVGATKSISSNGYIGAAFQGQTNSGTFANNVIAGQPDDDGKTNKFTWCVPVALSCWF